MQIRGIRFTRRALRRQSAALLSFGTRNGNLLAAVAGLTIAAALALAFEQAIFYRAAYLIIGLIGLSFVWAHVNLRSLKVRVSRTPGPLEVGQDAEAVVEVEGHSPLGKTWIEVQDQTDMPASPESMAMSLGGGSGARKDYRTRIRCSRRGVFTVGPVKVTSSDPFGIFRLSRCFGETQNLVVIPRADSLPDFRPPTSASLAGDLARYPIHQAASVAGIREYQPGDSMSRIHWPSSARLQRFMVKTLDRESGGAYTTWIVLDLEAAVQAGEGDESTEEYAVRIAASLASYFIQADRPVGLIACGSVSTVIRPTRDSSGRMQLFEALARAKADGKAPISEVLERECAHFGRRSSIMVISSAPAQRWSSYLQSQGDRVTAICLEASTFLPKGGEHGQMRPDDGATTPYYAVRRGDQVGVALSSGVGLAGGNGLRAGNLLAERERTVC